MKQKKSYFVTTEQKELDTMNNYGRSSIEIKSTVESFEVKPGNNSNTKSWISDSLFKLNKPITEVIQISVAEIIGTGILMYIGCLGCIGFGGQSSSLWQGSFAFGFGVFMAVQTFGHISGAHLNPSVTLGAIIFQLISIPLALVYWISQFIGALAGFGLIHLCIPKVHIHNGDANFTQDFCVTAIHENISVIQGLLFEIVATALLMAVTCSFWDNRNATNTDATSIKPGLTVTVLCVAIAPYTGCSMNPARSLAPAIINNRWTNHWVYWVGPLLGALISSLFYRFMFWPKAVETE